MNFDDRLDPELLTFIESIPDTELSRDSIEYIRKAIDEIVPPKLSVPAGTTLRKCQTGPRGNHPSVEMNVHEPELDSDDLRPAIVFLHGGGFVMGKPDQYTEFCAAWCKSLGATVICPRYRLAPENIYPAALEDAYTALAWIFENAENLRIDNKRVAVAGESAGGGLAACLTLFARDKGEHAICFQHLLFPMLDDRTAFNDAIPETQGQYVWTRENNKFGWEALLGQEPGTADISPYAAAARNTSYENLPPAFIVTGDMDLFTMEIHAYVQNLMKAGVPVGYQVYPGAPHAFHLAKDARVSKAYDDAALAAFQKAFQN